MSEKANKALVPVLRFPEFRGEWEENDLGKLAYKFLDGDWIESKDQSTDGVRLVQTGNVGIGEFIPKQANARYISEETFKRLRCTEIFPGDCLISRLPDPAGRSCLVPNVEQRMITAVDCTIVRFDEQRIIPYLFVIFSQTEQYFNEVEAQCSGSTRQRISRENLSRLKIPLPQLAEQQKIADCLFSIDELIGAQTQIINALKAHKKGLMQQLFPLDGETVPKLRFPEFRDTGEWEEKKLGELSQIVRGGSPRPIDEYITSDINGLSWLKIGDVDQGSKYVTSTKEKVLVTALSKTREVNPGDLIMSNSMSFGRPYILKIKSCIHDGWIAVTKIDERANRDYLYYLILSPTSQEYFLNNAAGSGVQNLNADIIKLLPVVIPEYSEQQKIADCLSSIDELIGAQTQKLDALKTHKKGLMQQLFPSANEVIDE